MSAASNDYTPGRGKVYVGETTNPPNGPLPRYITVTPDEGAIITIAVPWWQIEAAVSSAGYEIVPRSPASWKEAHGVTD